MNSLEILITAIALAMDAFAISVCKGLSVGRPSSSNYLSVALWFGFFQALMPLVGYFLGISFADRVARYDHWIAFVLLGLIGANMIKESLEKDGNKTDSSFAFVPMLMLAVATSIDALAVGITFAFLKVNVWLSVTVIGVVTAVLSAIGLKIGSIFGHKYKSKAEFAGGVVLICMGIKILIEHLF